MKTGKLKLLAFNSRFVHSFGDGDPLDGAAIITGLLKTVYKLDQKAIDSILKHGKVAKDGETLTDVATPDSILSTIATLDISRVKDLNDKIEKAKFQEGYKKAKAEVLSTAEAELKTSYGVESDLTGSALIDFIVDAKVKESGATGEDAIKKSATYQQMETKLKKELKDLKDAGDAKVKELETNYKKEGTFTKVGQSAIDILTGLNPVLPKNATVAETYKRDFLNELKGYEYEEKDGKILVSKGGKLLEDAHGNTLSWEEHVKNIAGNRFEFAQNNGGDNAANANDATKKKPIVYPAGFEKPKNADELAKIIGPGSKLKPEEKRVVMNEFRERTAAN